MAYDWPSGMAIKPIITWPGELRTRRERSRFDTAWSKTLRELQTEIRALGGRAVVLQVAMPESAFRIDGYPRATAKADHPGVILTMDSKHGALSYPCDTYDDWQDNVRAITLALEALRKVDRYGVTKRGEQYQGWKALPPGATPMPPAMTPREADEFLMEVTDLPYPLHADDRAVMFRRAQRKAHPDTGGDPALFVRVMQAGQILGLTR